jgi:hypothetical protein
MVIWQVVPVVPQLIPPPLTIPPDGGATVNRYNTP